MPDNVYIGRGREDLPASIWGNPHKIRESGSRAKALEQYEIHIGEHPELRDAAAVNSRGRT